MTKEKENPPKKEEAQKKATKEVPREEPRKKVPSVRHCASCKGEVRFIEAKGQFWCDKCQAFKSPMPLISVKNASTGGEQDVEVIETKKTYVAVVEGRVEQDEGTINAALIENPATLTVRVSTQPDARPAVTHYRVLGRSAHLSLVELQIETGRKHQIRVHMLHLGHPVVGDDRYGTFKRKARLCLHARELSFPHPRTGERLTFQAPVPALFADLVR